MLDKFIESPEIKPVMTKYFVLAKLDVGKEKASNPGAEKYMAQYGGKGAGTPFTVLLDSKGGLIINSRENGKDNIGYPADSSDIVWFMHMLKTAAPTMSDADQATIEKKLRAFKRK